MISEPNIDYFEAQTYMGIRTITPFKGMFAEIDRLLGELRNWIRQHDIANQGPFFLRYHVIDMNGPMDVEVGFIVSEALPGNERVRPGVLPSGHYAHLTYTGGGLAGNKALIGWARDNDIAWERWDDPAGEGFGCRYEMYLAADRLQPRKSKGVKLAIKISQGA